MTKRNKDKLIESYSEDYFSEPDGGFEIINTNRESSTEKKLGNAEDLLKDIYQFLLSYDSLEDMSEEDYAYGIINEITNIKEYINKFFRENI